MTVFLIIASIFTLIGMGFVVGGLITGLIFNTPLKHKVCWFISGTLFNSLVVLGFYLNYFA